MDINVAPKALIEGDNFHRSRVCERGQISIPLNLVRKRKRLRVLPPRGFKPGRLVYKCDAWIAQKSVVQSPSPLQRYGVFS